MGLETGFEKFFLAPGFLYAALIHKMQGFGSYQRSEKVSGG